MQCVRGCVTYDVIVCACIGLVPLLSNDFAQDAVPLVMLQCDSWKDPKSPVLVEFLTTPVDPSSFMAVSPAPSLHAVHLAPWGLLLIAHAMAADEHVKMIGAPSHPAQPGICSGLLHAMLTMYKC